MISRKGPVITVTGYDKQMKITLTAGAQGSVYLRLIINGTTYTNANTGTAWDASDSTTSNAVQNFKVTP